LPISIRQCPVRHCPVLLCPTLRICPSMSSLAISVNPCALSVSPAQLGSRCCLGWILLVAHRIVLHGDPPHTGGGAYLGPLRISGMAEGGDLKFWLLILSRNTQNGVTWPTFKFCNCLHISGTATATEACAFDAAFAKLLWLFLFYNFCCFWCVNVTANNCIKLNWSFLHLLLNIDQRLSEADVAYTRGKCRPTCRCVCRVWYRYNGAGWVSTVTAVAWWSAIIWLYQPSACHCHWSACRLLFLSNVLRLQVTSGIDACPPRMSMLSLVYTGKPQNMAYRQYWAVTSVAQVIIIHSVHTPHPTAVGRPFKNQ